MPRRRLNVLLPLEEAILEIGLRRLRDDAPEFYGFSLAQDLDAGGDAGLTAHGTLYKILDRLEAAGLLSSRWEDPAEIQVSRPRRRLYQVTDEAARALDRSRALQPQSRAAPGLAT